MIELQIALNLAVIGIAALGLGWKLVEISRDNNSIANTGLFLLCVGFALVIQSLMQTLTVIAKGY